MGELSENILRPSMLKLWESMDSSQLLRERMQATECIEVGYPNLTEAEYEYLYTILQEREAEEELEYSSAFPLKWLLFWVSIISLANYLLLTYMNGGF